MKENERNVMLNAKLLNAENEASGRNNNTQK